jgi:peptidoglycan-associated lipoprotein
MRSIKSWIVLGMATSVFAFGCADTKPVPKTAHATLTSALKSQWDKDAKRGGPGGGGEDASVETAGLHISDAIARACGLEWKKTATSFDYDSTTIAEEDRSLLAALAKCMSEGPLKGKGVALVGRADARGEMEYNMSLGEARADSVRRYLSDLGVQHERVSSTSRGEIDASGQDETGYAIDRRVDIDLAN